MTSFQLLSVNRNEFSNITLTTLCSILRIHDWFVCLDD